MTWLDRLLGRAPQTAPLRPSPGAATTSLSGRPTYANSPSGINSYVPRELSFSLIAQYRRSIPVIKRTTEILAGFVGCCCFEVEGNEPASDWLNEWWQAVIYGDNVGRGGYTWQNDLIDQAMCFGFCVGETEASPMRDGVARLWSYASPSIGFKTDPLGVLQVVQQTGMGEIKTLNLETIVRMTHDPIACNPQGESFLLALPDFSQALLDIFHAHRSTWRRNGIPIYHVHTQLPATLDDPEGAIAASVVADVGESWSAVMKTQYVDGQATDFFTANVGETKVSVIGADGAVMDIAVSNKTLMEQIIAATGIPPFLFGMQWSTTERLSKTQADLLLNTIDGIRREVEWPIQQAAERHRQLAGRKDAAGFKICWNDVSLDDLEATARAASFDAAAMKTRLSVGVQLWQLGIWDQEDVAEHVTGSPEVVEPMEEPPAMPAAPTSGQPSTPPEPPADPMPMDGQDSAEGISLKELLAEYGETFSGLVGCNGKH
jgi:hypothetical protein